MALPVGQRERADIHSHRSRPQADVVREASQLLAEGVKELNLVSQDSTYYGLDRWSARSGSLASPERFAAATRSLPADALLAFIVPLSR